MELEEHLSRTFSNKPRSATRNTTTLKYSCTPSTRIVRPSFTTCPTLKNIFVKLSYLEVTFPETSYLNVFLLCGPIIYRPDELFHKYLQTFHLLIELDIWYKFLDHTPSSVVGDTTLREEIFAGRKFRKF